LVRSTCRSVDTKEADSGESRKHAVEYKGTRRRWARLKNALDRNISGNGEGNDFGYRDGQLAIGQAKLGSNARTIKMTTAKNGTKAFNKIVRE
jgi:hypothetical protein